MSEEFSCTTLAARLLLQGNTSYVFFLNSVDDKGEVVRINFNNATRDTVFDISADKVKPFYAALKDFVDLLNSTDHKYIYKMKPGNSSNCFSNKIVFISKSNSLSWSA